MDIEALQKKKGHLIDGLLEECLSGDVPNLHDAMKYHMQTGGKRLRPLLAIVTYEALGGNDDKILPFAASCELLHNWFLVHDDIEDGDRVRRDKPALWIKYGLAHGINVGDYMAHKVFELISKSGEFGVDEKTVLLLTKAMVDTCLRTSEGQAMDINLRQSANPTEDEYLKMVQGKTGHYITVPMVGAAILLKKESLMPQLLRFGENLGAAFQITDDILDLTEGKGRGEIGRDIKEGKRSIMVVHCMQHCNRDERSALLGILDKNPENTATADVLYVKSLFEKHGSIEYAKKRAADFSEAAKRVAGDMQPELKDVMYFFADYMLKRQK